jgi:hypothetical protein
MKKIFLILVVTMALAACVSNGKPKKFSITDSDCGNSTRGRTDTKLKYGKDGIEMKAKSHVHDNTEFRIKLIPKEGFEGKKVKIVGVSGTLPDGTGTAFDWLKKEKSAKEAGEKAILTLCVPPEVDVGTVYKFDVEIEDLGKLDPRVEVVN